MPPLTSVQKAAVRQFVDITGANDKTAQKFLRDHRYRTEAAVDAYLTAGSADNGRVSAIEKVYDDLINTERGDTRETLSTETTIEYLQTLDVSLENAEQFVVMELVKAPAVGEISRQGFVDGWQATGLTSFSASQQKKHVRSLVNSLATDPAYFKRVYRHAFIAGKEAQQKALLVDHAMVFWKLLFSPPGRPWVTPKHDWGALWEDFIKSKWTRSVNKDMWNQVLEFAQKTMADEDLTFYSDQDAWPGVIDEFVVFYYQLYPKEDKDKMVED
ncbi:Scaffold-type E3 ligase [Gnomoniopsis sp. IMI 355080]|nr:Scaffold-type E3 ligase [Gnomoniopsis sp. IMI 355080]